jgi:hypothetical protein
MDVMIAGILVQITRHKNYLLEVEEWPEAGGDPITYVKALENTVEDKAEIEGGDKDGQKHAGTTNQKKGGDVGTTLPKKERRGDETRPRDIPLEPLFMGAAYLLSPYSIAACLAKSTQVFNTLAVVSGMYYATKGTQAFALSTLSYTYILTYNIQERRTYRCFVLLLRRT